MKATRTLLASSLAVLLAAGAAGAWEFEEDGNGHPLYWSKDTVKYRFVLANNPAGLGGESAVRTAFDSWNAASANVNLVFDGYEPFGIQQYDRKNMVYWEYDRWDFDPRLAAVTYHYYDTRNGELLDADIVFNGRHYSWSVGGGGYDIQSSATHEVGHFLGLGHSSDASATMHSMVTPGETKKRTLEADDLEGIDALYGGAFASGTNGIVSASGASGVTGGGGGGGGCSIGASPAGTSLDWLLVGGLLVGLALRRRPSA